TRYVGAGGGGGVEGVRNPIYHLTPMPLLLPVATLFGVGDGVRLLGLSASLFPAVPFLISAKPATKAALKSFPCFSIFRPVSEGLRRLCSEASSFLTGSGEFLPELLS